MIIKLMTVLVLKLIINEMALIFHPLMSYREWTSWLSSNPLPSLSPPTQHVDSRVKEDLTGLASFAFLLSWPFEEECCQQIVMGPSSFTKNCTFQQGVRSYFISSKDHLDLLSHSQVINFCLEKGLRERFLTSEGNVEGCQNQERFTPFQHPPVYSFRSLTVQPENLLHNIINSVCSNN